MLSPSRLADIIDQGRGREPADLVIKSVGILDLTCGEVVVGDIAIAGDRIVGIRESYEGATAIDGSGLVAVPGFIDRSCGRSRMLSAGRRYSVITVA